MSHGIEDVVVPAVSGTGYHRLYWNCTNPNPYSSVSYGTKSGFEKWTYRSASQKRAKDRNGWRMPAPYSAKFVVFPNLFGGLNAAKGCTDKYFGLQGTSASISGYSPTLKATPKKRNYGWNESNARDWVKTKALAKLRQSDVMFGVTWGERKKTASMVTSRLQDLLDFVTDLRRGRFGSIAQKLAGVDVFRLFLEIHFGWMQFVRDIDNTCKLIADKENGSYDSLNVFVKASVKVPYSESKVTSVGVASYQVDVTGIEKAKARLDFTPKGDYVNYREASAWLGDPASVAWELVHFSFVLDYFGNVGKFLEAALAVPAWNFKGGTTTTFGEYKLKVSAKPNPGWALVGATEETGMIVDLDRYVETNPAPALALNPEVLVGKMSATRITVLVSLLHVALTRR